MTVRSKLRIVNEGDGRGSIDLYGIIGWDVSASSFRRGLKDLGQVSSIDLHIHSDGGDVFDGLAIHNMLKAHSAKVTCIVDGVAISMASIVAMAGNTIEMADHSLMMIHNPLAGAYGDADDIRHTADLLDACKNQLADIYAQRTGLDRDEINRLMDEETWLEPAEACRLGFADRTSSQPAIAASFDASRFKNVPIRFKGANSVSTETQSADSDGRELGSPAPAPHAAIGSDAAKPVSAEPAKPVAVPEAAPEAQPSAIAEPAAKTGRDFLAAFGQQGAVWFVEGKTWDEAHALHSAGLQSQLDVLNAKLAAVNFGQASPVSAGDAEADDAKPTQKKALSAFGNVARIMGGIVMPKSSSN
jgi:ATP-dependent Clp endopeptidase proteolytic subunit ClpP